jgi:NAD(P)-dependent dehydrogenase (short-subunit alcohol dehydrogenase family)
MSQRRENRVAVVTGAAGGLGMAFAARLAHEGCDIAIADVASAAHVVADIEALGRRAYSEICDLAEPGDISRFAGGVLERFGRCDILVNNAAYIPISPFRELTFEEFRRVQAVNVDAPFLLCKSFVPQMIQREYGRIVNLASSSVWSPPHGFTAYITSKMAIIGLTRALASELGNVGITVNAISPGLTKHAGSTQALPPQAFESVRQRQFIGRTELPEDLCGTLAFLVSDDSAFITGQVINVDGGGFGF